MAFNQPLAGRVEPRSATWAAASAADRLAFYKQAGVVAVRVKRAELARAIGSNGRKMRPRKRPRPDGANGPVLTPHDERSRASRLLDARVWAGGVTLFWHSGMGKAQKKPWGTILGYHAEGKVRGAPVRDVRLSARGVNAVRAEMAEWWSARARDAASRRAADGAPAPSRRPGLVRRIQAALTARYRSLGQYFRDPRDGFE